MAQRLTRARRPGAVPASAADAVAGPDSVEVAPRHLRIGDWWAATLAVTGYPSEVGPGWLEPLTSYPGRLDVALHIEPVPPAVAADQLRKQRARLESERRANADKGRLDNPDADAAADDAHDLAYRIARGEGRLFRAGLYLTVYAATQEELAAEVTAVRTLAASLLLQTVPATFRTLQGWITSLPLATDRLRLRRAFDTQALAASFPFASADLASRDPARPATQHGVLYGLNAGSAGVVCWDRWAQDNHNSVILGRSGGGKSYLTKLDILRSLYQQVQVAIIDPEDEYARLANAVGGAHIHLGADGVRLNPFDLPAVGHPHRVRPDALRRRSVFLHTFLAVLLGEPPTATQRAAFDQGIMTCYERAGITADPRTWVRPTPVLADLEAVLRTAGGAARELASHLVPFTDGSHSGLFSGRTTTRPEGHLVVWSLRDLPDELKAAGTLLTLDSIWRRVTDPADRRRRVVVVDEAWLLMRQHDGANYLFRMAKAARKHWAGLAIVTQDAEDVLGSDLGRAVVNNAATQILLRQSPQAIDLVTDAFRLSAGEREFLLSAQRGEGLLAASATDRVAFKTVASDFEHELATTSPEFLASLPGVTSAPSRTAAESGDDVSAYFDGPLAGQLHLPAPRPPTSLMEKSMIPTSELTVGPLAIAQHNPAGSPVGRFLTNPGLLLSRIAHAALKAAATWGPWTAPPLLLAATAALATCAWLGRRRHARLAEHARQVTILTPPQADPAGAEALWGYLTGLLRPAWKRFTAGQPHLSFEYAWTAAGVTISLWVPGTVPPGMAERAIEAAWPGARTASGPAVAALPHGTLVTAGALRLARPEVLPLKAEHDSDPLRALLGAAAGLPGGDRAVVQILARPVTGARLRRARRAARRIKAGHSATRVARVFDLLTHQPARTGTGRTDPEHGSEVRAMVAKMASPQWEVGIRYAVATTAGDTPSLCGQLRGRAHSLASAFALYAGRNWLARQRLRHPEVINSRRMRRGGLLSVPELAALAHLPLDDAVPGLERAGARAVPPPPGVAAAGVGVKPLGDTDAGAPRPAGLTVADARHHVHVIGATGSGKTTLLINMVLADVAAGRGALVIDPKGDMITDLLARIPQRAARRVILFDPDDDGARPCLNVLAGPAPELVTDHLTGIFRRIYTEFWGPRTDDVFRSACLTLLHAGRRLHQPPTLADVPVLLADAKMRRRYTGLLDDDVLSGFWSWYDGLSDAARAQVVGPLLNKLRAFLLRGFVRSAIAGGPSTVDMASVLDGGLCLVRLPKGLLGDDTVQLLGSFIVAATWRAVSHRVRHDPAARRDAAMYLDECQNFLMLPHGLPDMLAEARAYRLSLVLAHQDLAQLPRELREGISANARSKIFFTCSPEDARDLQRHTSPTLTAHDLSHLGLYQAAARLVVAGQETPAFTLRTRPAPPAVADRAELIRRAARESYGLTKDRLQQARQGRDPREQLS